MFRSLGCRFEDFRLESFVFWDLFMFGIALLELSVFWVFRYKTWVVSGCNRISGVQRGAGHMINNFPFHDGMLA